MNTGNYFKINPLNSEKSLNYIQTFIARRLEETFRSYCKRKSVRLIVFQMVVFGLSPKVPVQFQASPGGVCVGKCGTGTEVSPSI
jgi:hypothetical protein